MVSWESLAVTLEHPSDGSLATLELNLSDVCAPCCSYHASPESDAEPELASEATKMLQA